MKQNKAGRKRGIDKQTVFLAAYRACASVSIAAECVPMDRALHYRWLRADPAYPARFEAARSAATKKANAAAAAKARRGSDHELRIAKLEAIIKSWRGD